jgi:hypothetical protein
MYLVSLTTSRLFSYLEFDVIKYVHTKKLYGFSLQAIYTDLATTASRRS